MLIDARSSQDLASWSRATASARSKYASALAASDSDDNAISPAIRSTSASHHLSFVVEIVAIASPTQCHALSICPRSAYALPRHAKYIALQIVTPVDRNSGIP